MNYDRFRTRVWHEKNKRMIYNKECSVFDILNFLDGGGVPMQCTGFKDCDGDLVYESDIVNSITMKITRGVVKWVNGCFDVYQDNKFVCSLIALKDFNIRGNTHEDSEFLEVKE